MIEPLMKRRLRFVAVLLLLISSAIGTARSAVPPVEKSCREHPRLIGECFNVHGRLSIYNGAPALRLWRADTRRMLGVSEQRFVETGYRNIPEDIESKINQDVIIQGDYVVCPFTRAKPKEMQLVCIESGKNLVIQKRK
jgi:hypothetical protein